jgi:ligand-binding sensor domain-containing protein/signal transduction histidine kinase
MSAAQRIALLLAAMVLIAAGPCRALDSTRLISQYGHTAWRIRDGDIPSRVFPMAQTKDGYLWIGTTAGVLRFDGVRFVPLAAPDGTQLPSPFVSSLAADSDGSLWIGTLAGLARWSDGQLATFPNDTRGASTLLIDSVGTLWFSSRQPAQATRGPPSVCRISGNAVQCYGKAEGLDLGADICCVGSLVQDADGSLLVSTEQAVVRWKPGEASTSSVHAAKVGAGIPGVMVLARGADDQVWVGVDARGPGLGLNRLEQGALKPLVSPVDGSAYAVQALFVDRAGTVWIGTLDDGIYRLRGDRIDHFKASDGLSGDGVYSFYEDREGNLWVSTSEGIDRFRDLSVATFTRREGLSVDEVDAVMAARDGRIWIGSAEALDILDGEAVSAIRSGAGLPGNQVTSLLQDHAGAVWVGIDKTLSIYENGRFVAIPGLDGGPLGFVYALVEDAQHDVWARVPKKLVRIRDHVAREEIFAEPSKLAADPVSGIWRGLSNGSLVRHRDGAPETVVSERKAPVRHVIVTADGLVLAGTDAGVIGWKDGVQRTLGNANGLACEAMHALIMDAVNDLWLYAQCGLMKIPAAELQRWWNAPDARLDVRVFDVFDGARPGQAPFQPAARSPDGRLWFANGRSLQMIDPAKLSVPSLPLPVHIEDLVADRKPYPAGREVRLPPNPRDIQIDYTALHLAVPQNVRFRYRLHGLDDHWQEPGARRQAFYTDLPAGTYRFDVAATRGDGVWSDAEASLTFVVAAAWYQTAWFRLACLVLGILALATAYRWRVRQIARRVHARFDERLAERTRLARELHDTLLQTIQGSKMVADDALDATDFDRLHQAMKRLSVWLGEAISEGREALNSLRISTTQTNDLAESFRRASEDCALHGAMDVQFGVDGSAVDMHPIVRDEVYRIGYEAIRNACAHSQATRVTVTLRYAKDHLSLQVVDDGVGIDAATAWTKPGHFGLHGMRERANRIGALLTISSTADAGTGITLVVPGNAIFRAPRAPRWSRLARTWQAWRAPQDTSDPD